MTSDRVYREGRSVEEALAALVEDSGTQFDPDAVQAMLKWVESIGSQLGKEGHATADELLASQRACTVAA
jgi:HD-GYP domain-containing protein (c-di-GMP phosphodiesterase class II)